MSDDNPDWTQRVDVPLKFTVMSDTPGGYGAAGQGLEVNDTETGLGYSGGKIDDHSARHEDGGADELTGITGRLNDHSARHENGGADPILNLGGNVTFPDRSYWRLGLSADQGILAGVEEKVALDVVVADNRGEFDSDNNRVVVENAGFYLLTISASYKVANTGDRLYTYLFLNGAIAIAAALFETGGAASAIGSASCGYYLSIGDYVELWVKNLDNDDTVLYPLRGTFFSGCLIA